VANALTLPASMLAAICAAVTLAARLRENAHHLVAWPETGDAAAGLCHHPGDFVPQDDVFGNSASKYAGHDRLVMMAKAAGSNPYQGLPIASLGRGHVAYFQFWWVAGLFYKKGFHGVLIKAFIDL
jgi:hypothetical protein